MKIRYLTALIILIFNSIIGLADEQMQYDQMRDATEEDVILSQMAFLYGDYWKCIEYAEYIRPDISAYYINEYNLAEQRKACRANARVHMYAAAACYNLSMYNQIGDISSDSFYADDSSYDLLSKAYHHYLYSEFYSQNFLFKQTINEHTLYEYYLEFVHELYLTLASNLAAIEFLEANQYDREDAILLRKVKANIKKVIKIYEDQIFAHIDIARADIPTYYTLKAHEILSMFNKKKNTETAIVKIKDFYTDLQRLIPSLGNINDNKDAYTDIMNSLKSLLWNILNLVNNGKIDWGLAVDMYLYYLCYSEYVTGAQKDFEPITWQQIKNALEPGEYVLIFYEAPILPGTIYHVSQHNMNHFYAFVIGWNTTYGDILQRKLNTAITEENYKTWQTMWPGMEDVYVLGTEYMKTLDCAGTNENVHMIHSLKSLINRQKESSSKKIRIVGNLDYTVNNIERIDDSENSRGIGKHDPLTWSKAEIEFLKKSLSEDNLTVLEGANVTKSQLLMNSDENILHIATHGDVDSYRIHKLNQISPLDGITGENIFRSSYLMLSLFDDYRTIDDLQLLKKNETILSGYDIIKHDFSHIDLVYLDACKTAYAKNLNGLTFSLAEAFYIAGAKNIIAYIEPVSDKIAFEFAKLFYSNLFEGLSIHDSFYDAKKEIQRIAPDLQVVLWE